MYTIYGQPGCPYCQKAKEFADGYVDYEYIDISESASAQYYIKESLGAKTVPQIFDGETHVGGYDEFVRYVSEKAFDEGIIF